MRKGLVLCASVLWFVCGCAGELGKRQLNMGTLEMGPKGELKVDFGRPPVVAVTPHERSSADFYKVETGKEAAKGSAVGLTGTLKF